MKGDYWLMDTVIQRQESNLLTTVNLFIFVSLLYPKASTHWLRMPTLSYTKKAELHSCGGIQFEGRSAKYYILIFNILLYSFKRYANWICWCYSTGKIIVFLTRRPFSSKEAYTLSYTKTPQLQSCGFPNHKFSLDPKSAGQNKISAAHLGVSSSSVSWSAAGKAAAAAGAAPVDATDADRPERVLRLSAAAAAEVVGISCKMPSALVGAATISQPPAFIMKLLLSSEADLSDDCKASPRNQTLPDHCYPQSSFLFSNPQKIQKYYFSYVKIFLKPLLDNRLPYHHQHGEYGSRLVQRQDVLARQRLCNAHNYFRESPLSIFPN